MDGSSMEDEEELQFQRLWDKRQRWLRGIIAVTGPPSTCKTRLAKEIGGWAKCPALCIQHLFSPTTTTAPAAEEEEEDEDCDMNEKKTKNEQVQLVQHAFTNLCKLTAFHLKKADLFDTQNPTVVIKSRLSSTFELQRLQHLLLVTSTDEGYHPLLFIECCFTNEYRWKRYFEEARQREEDDDDDFNCRWYRPGSWEEMDKAGRDYYSQSDWDLALLQHQQLSTPPAHPIIVRRLVVDPVEDIFPRSSFYSLTPLTTDFTDAIKYLLTTPQHEIQLLLNIDPPQHNHPSTTNIDYVMVGLHELRPILFEMRVRARLAAANGTKTHTYCPGGDQCVFQMYNHEGNDDDDIGVCCGVCGEQVVHPSSSSAECNSSYYACRLCILTLHKPCAERLSFKALAFDLGLLLEAPLYFHELMSEQHACQSCCLDGGGAGFDEECGACSFQTHLKCGLLPTIIHHNSHPPHFLSLLVTFQYYRCRACGYEVYDLSYSCRPCGLYYHLKCALLPLQMLNHQHGGHGHVMRLLYSHHDTDEPDSDPEEEESYWCDVCGDDMDPHDWCYSCQDCPYYSAHLHCARGYDYLSSNVKNSVFVPQIQSQLEAAMAEVP